MTPSRKTPEAPAADTAQAESPADEQITDALPAVDSDLIPPTYVADAAVVEATSAMERARAALEAAEAEFSAAEFAAERAQLEEQMRREQAEDQRIARLGQQLPKMRAAVEFDLNQFRLAVAGLRENGVSMDTAVRAWMQMSHTREVLRRIFGQITTHAANRSDDAMRHWDRKAAEWDVAMRAAVDIRPDDFVAGRFDADEDLDESDRDPDEADKAAAHKAFTEALARVNLMINEQSQAAPIPQNRSLDDTSIPGPWALGVYSSTDIALRNPLFRENPLPRTFSADFDEALTHAVQAEVDVYLPGVSPLKLGGVTVAQARDLAAAASAQIRAAVNSAPTLYMDDIAGGEQSE